MPRFPNLSPEDRDAAIEAAAKCKVMRHYFEFDSSSDWTPEFGYGVTYRCVNCGGYRYDTHSPVTDELLCRSYDMPPWYAEAKMPHAEWRAEYLNLNSKHRKQKKGAGAHRLPGQRNSYPTKGAKKR